MMSQREIDDLVQKSKTFAKLFTSGALDVEALNRDAAAVAAIHGIKIPIQNKEQYNKKITEKLAQLQITRNEDFAVFGNNDAGCTWCEIGMTTAFSALIIMTVAAVAAIVIGFFPQVGVPTVIAFFQSTTAVEIVFGIILSGAEVLAQICCTEWGACP
jgi:hypothetical protein